MSSLDSVPDPSAVDRLGLLAERPVLRGLDVSVLREIDALLESVHVPGGSCVVRRGQSDVPLMLVVEGGLRASFVDSDGHSRVVFEYFRGATMGEGLLLSGRPSPLDLHAIRDSHLLCLTPERFSAVALRHPELTLGFARVVTSRLVELSSSQDVLECFSRKTDRLPRSIAVLAAGGESVRRTRDLLLGALSTSRAMTRLSVSDAHAVMDPGVAAPSDSLVFECEPSDASWMDFSLRQADRIMVLLDDQECQRSGRQADVWREARLGERPGHLELAIVHPASAELPRSGAGYAELPGVARLHHVRGSDARDAERLARWLLDRPVGLVLGGGGAYGIAHVGVLKALEEAGVPVDIVGGTSMGAIFAGTVARGWSADRTMEEVRALFASRLALYDFTIPFRSLLRGKKLDHVLEGIFDEIAIPDLWRPFFCVATDISRARALVQESGRLRDAIRSSCSIPGLFPPHQSIAQSLVDGGLVDNVPIDVMNQRCRGPIIAVDALPYRRQKDDDGAPSTGRLRSALQRLKPSALPLFNTLMQATLVGSQHTTETSFSSRPPALYLVPQLGRFRMLEWRAYQGIFEAGYACAKRELDAGALPRSLWEGSLGGGAPFPTRP